jgi:hypothetical protein
MVEEWGDALTLGDEANDQELAALLAGVIDHTAPPCASADADEPDGRDDAPASSAIELYKRTASGRDGASLLNPIDSQGVARKLKS